LPGAYRGNAASVTEGSPNQGRGYSSPMAILILVLVVLAIIALILYIARRTRV
jgi:hypothetical protein